MQSNALQEQKSREASYLQAARSIWPGFPSGEFDQPNPPAPDALFRIGSEVVGVEIRELYQPSDGALAPRSQESERESISHRANEIFRINRDLRLVVGVRFRDLPLAKARREVVAQGISDAVSRQQLVSGAEISLRGPTRDPALPNEVEYLNIRSCKSQAESWYSIEAGWIPRLGRSFIEAEIATKEAKVAEYLKSCDKVYLMLVANSRYLSSMIALSDLPSRTELNSRFAEILLLWLQERELVRL